MRVAIALGLRLARPRRYLEWLQVITVALVVALSTLSGIAFVSAHNIVESQNRVMIARSPHQPAAIPPGGTLPKIATVADTWGGITVTRQVIVAGANGSTPHPPGVPRAPGPGEAFVSPAVWELRGTSAPAWSAVRGMQVLGLIAEEGLTDPAEARIILGGSADSTRRAVLSEFDHFSNPQTPGLVSLGGHLGFLAAAALCLVFGGLVFAAILAIRLRESELARRNRLLSAIGLGPMATRLVSCSELVLASLLGSVAGLFAFNGWWRRLDGIPGTDLHFWANSSAVDTPIQVAVGGACVAAVALLSAALVQRDRRASTRMTRTIAPPSRWNGVPLAGGVLVMSVAALAESSLGDNAKILALVGAGGALVAIPFAGRPIVFSVGNAWARRARSAGGLLGGRWTCRTDTAAFKVAQIVSVGLFALCLSVPIVENLRVDTSQAESNLASAKGTNLLVTGTTLEANEVEALAGVRSVISVVEAADSSGGSVVVVLATCDDVSEVVEVDHCGGDAQWIDVYGSDLGGYVGGIVPPFKLGRQSIPIDPSMDDVVYAPISGDFQGAIRVDPSVWRPAEGVDRDFLVNLDSGRPTQERFAAELASHAPTSALANSFGDLIEQSNALLPASQFVQTSLVVSLAAMVLALIAAVLRGIQDTAHAESLAGGLGARRVTTVYARLLSQFISVLLQCLLAVAAAVAFWLVFAHIDPLSSVPASTWALVLCAPPLLATLTGVVAMPAPQQRRLR